MPWHTLYRFDFTSDFNFNSKKYVKKDKKDEASFLVITVKLESFISLKSIDNH